jgi:hypothetical protein
MAVATVGLKLDTGRLLHDYCRFACGVKPLRYCDPVVKLLVRDNERLTNCISNAR